MNEVELRNIYNNVINKWNLAVTPKLEEFVEFMNSDGTNMNDPDEIEK